MAAGRTWCSRCCRAWDREDGCVLCPSCRATFRASQTPRKAEIWRERRDAGVCPSCEGIPIPGAVYCDYCGSRRAEYAAAVAVKKKALGICLRCPNEAAPGKLHCQDHLRNFVLVKRIQRHPVAA